MLVDFPNLLSSCLFQNSIVLNFFALITKFFPISQYPDWKLCCTPAIYCQCTHLQAFCMLVVQNPMKITLNIINTKNDKECMISDAQSQIFTVNLLGQKNKVSRLAQYLFLIASFLLKNECNGLSYVEFDAI